MAETVVSFLISQLSTLLLEEGRLSGRFGKDIQEIKAELGYMRAFLRVAEAKEDDDPTLQEWIRQVREAAYDTEDVLDEFIMLRFDCNSRPDGCIGSFRSIFASIKNLRARHRIASEVQQIKKRTAAIFERHQRYKFEYGTTHQTSEGYAVPNNNISWRINRDEALLVEERKLVGINGPKKLLISQLLDSDSQLKVVSVLGMGGLGKTTLIRRVYEDTGIRREFKLRAWVTVSQTVCQVEELIKDLIEQFCKEIFQKSTLPEISYMKSHGLKVYLKELLQGKRYLIVLDDVWDTDIWNNIKFALPEGGGYGNRVILTTRKNNVASAPHLDSHGYLHKMEPLSFEDSWTLFCRKTFDEDQCRPSHLMNVCESILGKCEGLPLAIVAISGLLALKDRNNLNEWEMVRRGLGAELEGNGRLDRIKNILSLSYNELPYYLRTCLLYLSIFPEDYPIPCSSLTSLWAAERFVQSKGGMIVEEVAQEYLRELINRSLIQVTDECDDGLPLKCRIHDLLREILVPKSRELNIMTISNVAGNSSRCPESDEKVRRLVIHPFVANGNSSSLIQLQEESNCFKYLRSLITFGSIESSLSKSYIDKILCRGGSRRLLKILDLRNSQLNEVPDEVYNLIHLRCLCLRSTKIEVVSKAIGKLENLEILDLAETRVSELPKDILKLQKLRHLLAFNRADYTKDYMVGGIKAPYRIGELQSLLCLYIIDADSDNTVVREIGKLTQMRTLGITNLRREDGRELCSSLEKLRSLIGLEVSSIHRDEVIDLDHSPPPSSSSSLPLPLSFPYLRRLFLWGRLERLPQWIPSLRSLTRVKLCWSEMEDDPLESLEHLPNLSGLYLTQAYRGDGLRFRAGGFLKLKRLSLRKSRGMKWVRVEEGAMPNLHVLRLTDLKLMEELPDGIQHLTKLRLVSLNNMSGNLIEKLLVHGDGDGGEERRKIAHVPQIKIANYINTDNKWQVCYL